MRECANCGRELQSAATYCEECGGDAIGAGASIPPIETVPVKAPPITSAPHHVRSFWLSSYILLGGIVNVYLAYKYLFDEQSLREMLPGLPSWIFPLLGFKCLLSIAFLMAIWDLRKWGVYGMVLFWVFGLGLNTYMGQQWWTLAVGSLGWVIWYLLLRPVWKYMR